MCIPITPEQKASLQKEVKDYEANFRFVWKMDEVKGLELTANPYDLSIEDKYRVNPHHTAIDKYLREKVLQPDWSVLELGCGAGMMLRMVQQAYDRGIGAHKEIVGVELVTGWVKFAQSYYKDIKVFEGEHDD
jgi:ubiquinone/menaquinone biosynthesis C-methylase UbiE